MTHELAHSLAVLPSFEEQSKYWSQGSVPAHDGADKPTLGDLSRRLADAGIMDLRSIDAPGAVVVMPWGVELVRQFRAGVEHRYEAAGYEPHMFPHVAPESIYAPAVEMSPEVQQFLLVADREGLAAGRARGVLAPTGEAMIYHHWARTVRSRGDLPVRLYREATYFRPTATGRGRAGRGVLRPLEAPDVHEFHCAVADEQDVRDELRSALAMVDGVLRDWRAPVLWSVRPPWTNNGQLYRAAFGADTLLPTGETVQVGVVYDQGRVFSRAYNIRVRDIRPSTYPLHVTGCVTRRVVLAHMFGSDTARGFALHPAVSPVQVHLRGSADELNALKARLAERGVRVRSEPASGRKLAAVQRRAVARGIPAHVLVQAPRRPGDLVRVVVGDAWGTEQELHVAWPGGVDSIVEVIDELLRAVAESHDGATRARWSAVRRATLSQADSVVRAGGVAIVALDPSAAAVARVEKLVPGEVLGLVRAEVPVRCAVTEAIVHSYAAVGRRA
jgi:hypothetical protein